MIDLDFTLLIQLVNFIITLVVLNYLLIKPVRNIIAERRKLELDMSDRLSDLISEEADRLSAYETTLREARALGADMYKEAQDDANSHHQKILDHAHREAEEYIYQHKEENGVEAAKAFNILSEQIPTLTKDAAAKLLA